MSPCILLVDEDREQLRVLEEAFTRLGYRVRTALSGPTALEQLRSEPPDGLVLDLLLPGLSGFRLMEAARRMAPAECLPILAVTDVYDTPHSRRSALERFALLDLLPRSTTAARLAERFHERAGLSMVASPLRHAAERLRPRDEEGERVTPSRAEPPEENTQPSLQAPRFDEPEAPTRTPLPTLASLATERPRYEERNLTPLSSLPAPGGPAQPPLRSRDELFPEESLPEPLRRGDFLQTPFPALLHGLVLQRATGALYLRHERKKKVLHLRAGVPREVKSNLVQECLGRLLLREGLIDEQQLDESLARMKARSVLQGQALIEMGSLTERDLRYGLERQLETKILEIFTWPWGAYRLQREELDPPPPDRGFSGQICALIREGMLRFYPRERVLEELNAWRDRCPRRSGDPALLGQEMGLSPSEEAFLQGLDGSRTVQQLLERAGTARDPVGRLLLGLLYVRKAELLPGS